MLRDCNPILQAFLGTLLTWGLTAAGAGLVFFVKSTQRKLLDGSLGFAAGVMIAASYWSLLAPAIEMAENAEIYGSYSFLPVSIGFFVGALFVYATDVLISKLSPQPHNLMIALYSNDERQEKRENISKSKVSISNGDTATIDGFHECSNRGYFRRRAKNSQGCTEEFSQVNTYEAPSIQQYQRGQWKRIILLVIAITVHNIPEGLAVGIRFAAIGSTPSATFESARSLAIGIGIQNFPEGLAVSLPLQAAGYSTLKSFWYGQLSGMVEPIFGIIGALALTLAQPALPYALAFAAGAMIYVVIDDIIPEANTHGNGKLATWGSILGFLIMMTLDIGFAA